ncbi:hypothetical protein [Paenibacillus piri]|uniref:Uncharacterized protein n=1 Tax=Paenibacillus piri TaxID=2547395 RepID=A0A4R5KUR3_9BACL|nr:hypothetical protein [Paenibacillus piri]TDF98660.1 hypothetical protein E1757_08965 [Paenibacillus piri]
MYLSYDEKPGTQAIGNTAEDLVPVPGEHPTISRERLITSMAMVKKAAALANMEVKQLNNRLGEAIVQAAEEIMALILMK